MKYIIENDLIILENSDNFLINQILECGQVFRYFELENSYTVISLNKIAIVTSNQERTVIKTNDVNYFIKYFDLDTDYSKIKSMLVGKNFYLDKAVEFGRGIRILKQDSFEMLVSFIISSNNNISRIKTSIERICNLCGEKITFYGKTYYAFPTLSQLSNITEQQLKDCGLGYRAPNLIKTIDKLNNGFDINKINKMNTAESIKYLQILNGIGPKVCDCVLLFGFSKMEVFPVDTWIEQAYNEINNTTITNRVLIREKLVKEFGDLSGYAQQYMFFYKRSK